MAKYKITGNRKTGYTIYANGKKANFRPLLTKASAKSSIRMLKKFKF